MIVDLISIVKISDIKPQDPFEAVPPLYVICVTMILLQYLPCPGEEKVKHWRGIAMRSNTAWAPHSVMGEGKKSLRLVLEQIVCYVLCVSSNTSVPPIDQPKTNANQIQ